MRTVRLCFRFFFSFHFLFFLNCVSSPSSTCATAQERASERAGVGDKRHSSPAAKIKQKEKNTLTRGCSHTAVSRFWEANLDSKVVFFSVPPPHPHVLSLCNTLKRVRRKIKKKCKKFIIRLSAASVHVTAAVASNILREANESIKVSSH